MTVDDDNVYAYCEAIRAIGRSITPAGALGGTDAAGGHVESLTEAVMGMTAALVQIASAIERVADAIESHA